MFDIKGIVLQKEALWHGNKNAISIEWPCAEQRVVVPRQSLGSRLIGPDDGIPTRKMIMKTARLWIRSGAWWRLGVVLLFLALLSSRVI